MAWLMENMTMVLAVLLGVSEALALIPGVKANSVFTLVLNIIKQLKSAVTK